MSTYAHYNNIYRMLKSTAKLLGYSDKEVFTSGGLTPTNSQLDGWGRGPQNKHFKVINESETLAFATGLNKLIYEKKMSRDKGIHWN